MDRVTRTNKQVFDIPGTITGPDGLHLRVYFDLIEMEDLVDGMPADVFSYGVLRYVEPLDPRTKAQLLYSAPLTLTGGGMRSTLCMYQLNSFTLADTIREFHPGVVATPVTSLAAA